MARSRWMRLCGGGGGAKVGSIRMAMRRRPSATRSRADGRRLGAAGAAETVGRACQKRIAPPTPTPSVSPTARGRGEQSHAAAHLRHLQLSQSTGAGRRRVGNRDRAAVGRILRGDDWRCGMIGAVPVLGRRGRPLCRAPAVQRQNGAGGAVGGVGLGGRDGMIRGGLSVGGGHACSVSADLMSGAHLMPAGARCCRAQVATSSRSGSPLLIRAAEAGTAGGPPLAKAGAAGIGRGAPGGDA